MQSFVDIAQSWLTDVTHNQLSMPFQVVETNNSGVLAQHICDLVAEQNIQVFHIEFAAKQICDPYQLFHQIIHWYAEEYGHDHIEFLLEQSSYKAHRKILKHWFRGEFYYRKEALIVEESLYEQREFFIAMERVLIELATLKPFVVLINHIEAAPFQIIEALNQLLISPERNHPWGVMGFVGQAQLSHIIEENTAWHECLKVIERKGLILPCQMEGKVASKFNWRRAKSLRSFDEQYQMLLAATDLFAYHDVIRMVAQIRHKYNDKHNGQLLFLSAYASLMSGDSDTAVVNFTKVQNRLQATETRAVLIASYFWQSICYTLMAQEKFARGAQEQCEKLALEYDDSRWYALAQYAGFYVDAHIAQHRLKQVTLESLRYLLSELGYKNLLSMVLTQVYSQTEGFDSVSSKSYLNNTVMALRLAREQKNALATSVALHSMGVVHMRLGNFKQTQRLYEISLKLRERNQPDANLVPMLNGLGYFFVGQEQWQQAWSYYDRALSLLIRHRKFNEVSNTLYNFCWLYAQTGHFQRALDTMNDLLELMFIRGIESVPFRNLKDLYILKGWLHLQLKQPIQARNCLIRVQAFHHLHRTSFSQILEHVLSARIAFFEGDLNKARYENNKAVKVANATIDLDVYLDTNLRLEMARLFVDLSLPDAAQPLFTDLRQKAYQYKLTQLAHNISRASIGQTAIQQVPVADIAQPYHLLLELAKKESQLARMQHSLADIHQVNLLIEQSANEPDVEKFLAQIIDILDRRVPANELAIVVRNSHQSEHQIDYLALKGATQQRLEQWLDLLGQLPRQETFFEFQGDQCAAWPMLMNTAHINWLLISGDNHQKAVWNHDFLRLVTQQLGLILDRRLREAYLERRNKTDLLTGIMNRAGIYERLQKMFSQMTRQPKQTFALCYFDLDHFKYFNDQFGHELGDQVLKNLVQCVQGQLRGNDELGRLGGDEFILLLQGSTRQAIAAMLERLRAKIAMPDWWLPLFSEYRNTGQNPVPQQEWISASFGVVLLDKWPEQGVSQIDLLAQGDAAMYEAKAKGKNCIVVADYQSS